MHIQTQSFDTVVCGGGLAGLCAAIAAARHGAKTCLVHDRPVLGGNSSSEIGVTVHGAAHFHGYARETGILSEALIEERHRNHETINENGWTNSVWDLVLYELALAEPNLTLHLNTAVTDVLLADGTRGSELTARPEAEPSLNLGYRHRPAINPSRRIAAVEARVSQAETLLVLRGQTFIDCTGDALVGHLAGCEWRWGTEGRAEFGEIHAPAAASTDTMGNSIHFFCRDVGRPVPFTAPPWAVKHEDASYFYDQGRIPHDPRGGFWWLEIGIPWDTIHDNETIRHELTRHALGVWDWMKNKDPKTKERCANFALEWIGQVPGKRENRRLLGLQFLTENSLQADEVFPDEIAFGGWFIDLHTPGGLLAPTSEPSASENQAETSLYKAKSMVGPYSLPLGICISRDLDNLLMAGRNVSTTHAALGTVRVMATTALLGQACGTAAALGARHQLAPEKIRATRIGELQQILLRDGCFLPNISHADAADLARQATASASSSAILAEAAPESADADSRPWYRAELSARRAQFIALGAQPEIRSLQLWISNATDAPREIAVELRAAAHIWDYRAEAAGLLASGTLLVPPGGPRWIEWRPQLRAPLPACGYVRLELAADEHLRWHASADLVPGHLSAFAMPGGKLRRFAQGLTMAFLIDPPQAVFGPENTITGAPRPHRSPNLWRSDPAQPLPQWLDLAWPEPQRIAQVELQFPGNLLSEYHATPPLWSDPETPRDYTLLAETADGSLRPLLEVRGNHQRHRRHALPEPVTTRRLRIHILATNGDASAAIHELRCYA